ncbi:Thiosulfate sulfurtransferase GlpE [Mycovorax composti]|jgi:Rhodanese-related sulfurtransferase|uniref:Thiosulfate sulfurtransferase GlpE n=2 Tax=Chitinophagaceae TaxID=563835 RepID=A0ABZ2EHQ8_9BACT
MKKFILIVLIGYSIGLTGCANGQANNTTPSLEPIAFSEKLTQSPFAIVLDVRTPDEFSKGHLKNAVNFNWNDPSFASKVAKMDKETPVFVYCLSGGRSAAAAKQLREQGFKEVYELNGGILKWKAANLPIDTDTQTSVSEGITLEAFEHVINSEKKVLVDFYAEWCAPCKKMEPYINEISKNMSDKVKVVRIDVDANPALSEALKIDALPVLHIYQNNKRIWSHTGYITKEEVLKQLKD